VNPATIYDTINTAIFLPWGGSRRLRQSLVNALDVQPGHRILELGCGTGQVTARLLAAGADVVAVDALPAMLDRARTRAPRARFVEGDAITSEVGDGFDRVVLSFVLHNVDRPGRVRILRRAELALAPGGRIGVLEWALPAGPARARLWRWFLDTLEPSATVPDVLDKTLDVDVAAAGLRQTDRRSGTGGRTQILVLRRRDPDQGDKRVHTRTGTANALSSPTNRAAQHARACAIGPMPRPGGPS
jgi:SAM-dependent methyltransferase